jgi:hypothetical protein
MNQVIIYKQDSGATAVVYPTQNAIDRLGMAGTANKHVPAGKPYKIIDSSLVPSNRDDRDLWIVNDTDLTDGVGHG